MHQLLSKKRLTPFLLSLVCGITCSFVFHYLFILTPENNALTKQSQQLIQVIEKDLLKDIPSNIKEALLAHPIFTNPEQINAETAHTLVQSLDLIKSLTNASLVYILDEQGTVLSATPISMNKSIVGNNFGYRRYFQTAMANKMNISPAVGAVTKVRGLYVSMKITDYGDNQSLILVIKKPVQQYESLLAEQETPAFLVAPDQVIFVSNQPDLLYKTFTNRPIEAPSLQLLKRYAERPLSSFPGQIDTKHLTVGKNKYFCQQSSLTGLLENWTLVTTHPQSILGPVSAETRFNFYLITAFLILILYQVIRSLYDKQVLFESRSELSKQHQLLDSIIEQLPGFLVLSSPNGSDIERMNHNFQKFLNITPEDLNTVNWFHCVEHADLNEIIAHQIPSSGLLKMNEVNFISPNQEELTVQLSIVKLDQHQNNTEKILAIAFDITSEVQKTHELIQMRKMQNSMLEKKTKVLTQEIERNQKIQQRLFEQKSFQQRIIDALPVRLFVYTPPPNPRIRIWDHTLETLLGITKQDLFKSTPDDQSPMVKLFRATMDHMNQEELIFDHDRIKTTVRISKVPLYNNDGNKEYILGIAQDITHELQLQEEARQLEVQLLGVHKMESIGQLAAGISHEINTPTQFVGDNLRFIEETLQDLLPLLDTLNSYKEEEKITQLPEELKKILVEHDDLEFVLEEIPESINESLEGIQRVSNIVRTMKNFAHIDTEDFVSVNLNDCINDSALITKNEWKYHSDLETHLDDDLPDVQCIPGEINQVLVNLIVNAAHAIEDRINTDAAFEKGLISFTTKANTEMVTLIISDNGCGIPEHVKNKVFNPFFTTKEIGRGTGQGLALALNTIHKKHHGEISFNSTPGEGTTFTIHLPIHQTFNEVEHDL